MSTSADPKPGRWILPLVILGMIGFTYFFVRELPEASPDTTLVGGGTTTAPDSSSTTSTPVVTDPEVQAYLNQVDEINADLQLLRIELVTVNTGFDADPREIEYVDAVPRFQVVADDSADLLTQFDALTPPLGLETNHAALRAELVRAADAATDAYEGLTSDNPGDVRRDAVTEFDTAAEAFDGEAGRLHDDAAAG